MIRSNASRGALPPAKLRQLVREARQNSFDFLEWKKQFVLRQHWLAHNQGTCARCSRKLTRAYLGETDRRTFFCAHDQTLYATTAQARAAAATLAGARKGRKPRPGAVRKATTKTTARHGR